MIDIQMGQNLYDVLQLQLTADAAEVRKAYRNAALRTHPDKAGGSKEAFHAVTVAFEVLSCPISRSLYDGKMTNCCLASSEGRVGLAGTTSRDASDSLDAKYSMRFTSTSNPSKRQQAAHCPGASKRDLRVASQLEEALDLVRSVLQSMSPVQRQNAIMNMASRARVELLKYMECYRQAEKLLCHVEKRVDSADASDYLLKATPRSRDRSASTYGVTKVYASSGWRRVKYQANIHVKALRLYTREQYSIEAAIEHQIILVQMKQALNARSLAQPDFWDNHKAVLQVCHDVLDLNSTSEAELGLRAWVHLRATRWLGPQRLASAATALAEGVEIHARLLRARAMSWEALRAEWLRTRKRCSAREAEELVDRARYETQKRHLARAVMAVERLLRHRAQRAAKRSTQAARGAVPPHQSGLKRRRVQ